MVMTDKEEKLVGENRSLRLKNDNLQKQLRRLNRMGNGELREDYKLLVTFDTILKLLQGYEVTSQDINNVRDGVGDIMRIMVVDGEEYIRPKDVKGEFVLNLIKDCLNKDRWDRLGDDIDINLQEYSKGYMDNIDQEVLSSMDRLGISLGSVTGQFLLNLVNMRYEEILQRQIGDCPKSWVGPKKVKEYKK